MQNGSKTSWIRSTHGVLVNTDHVLHIGVQARPIDWQDTERWDVVATLDLFVNMGPEDSGRDFVVLSSAKTEEGAGELLDGLQGALYLGTPVVKMSEVAKRVAERIPS